MKTNLVEIQLHGNIFEGIKEKYKLAVKSVAECIHAINCITQQKFYSQLLSNDKKGIKYKILINGRNFESSEPLTIEKPEKVLESELAMNIGNLKTIDIVPVIEAGDSDIGAIIAGVLLVVVGIVLMVVPGGQFAGAYAVVGGALLIGGLGLIAAGIINLLSQPPAFEDFREITGGGKASYLFQGPTNTTREGGPCPVGYGRLLVGSHVISASYEISDADARERLTS